MLIRRHLYNSREPDNILILKYNGSVNECWGTFTWSDHVDSDTGEHYLYNTGIAPTTDNKFMFYISYLDDNKRSMNEEKICDNWIDAWKQLPAFITNPDHFEDEIIKGGLIEV